MGVLFDAPPSMPVNNGGESSFASQDANVLIVIHESARKELEPCTCKGDAFANTLPVHRQSD